MSHLTEEDHALARSNLNQDVYQSLLISYNEDVVHLEHVLRVLCLPPKFSTLRIRIEEVPMSCAIDQLQDYFNKQCTSLGRDTFVLYPHPLIPECLLIENRGPHQVKELESPVAVDMACGMAVLRGANIFVQGILAAQKGLKAGDLVAVYAILEGKCLKGSTSFDTTKCLFLGNGIAAVSRSDLFKADGLTRGLGISMTQPIYEAPSLNELPFAWAFPQNLPSIACVHALEAKPGERILDMCAAPGGKTSHIASLVGPSGEVIALEKSRQRTKTLEKLMHDQRLMNVRCYTLDATKACSTDLSQDEGCGPPFRPSSFDRILVDAPCSALGQRPCRVNKISLNQLKSFPVVQSKLLHTAHQLLRPGGVLVYSTCTICAEECESQVARLLAHCPDLCLVDTPGRIGGSGLPCKGLTREQCALVQRFDPSPLVLETDISSQSQIENIYNIDTIGFFVAKFERQSTQALPKSSTSSVISESERRGDTSVGLDKEEFGLRNDEDHQSSNVT